MTARCMLWFPWDDEEEEEFSKTPRKEMQRKEKTEYKPVGFLKSQLKKSKEREQLSDSESSSSPTVLRHKESMDLLSGSGPGH